MREAGIAGVSRRRDKGVTRRHTKRPSFSDRVKRQFTAERPDRLWVADITQHRTGEGWELGPLGPGFARSSFTWLPLSTLTRAKSWAGRWLDTYKLNSL